MKHQFTLPHFQSSTFEIETSIWTGRPTLFKDGIAISRSDEKGKPFLIPDDSGEIVRAYPKPRYTDIAPALEIDGIRYDTVDKLAWHQYTLCLIPLLLLFIGGGIGGIIGGVASAFNLQTIRATKSVTTNYLKVIGITLLAFALYFFVVYLILS
ncbi:hypothetical protein [Sphingobacterium gobiense]|uniref:Uncharacterized protein n=1 Tax=Sphingobacterium gobiense TaxID=1382456 RepID=A0A2S9JV76_9SPHI|nr:hypothetical protein [Sphingobacterium gobiense]PRD57140.1 hypothetical protein C5749_08030 [Sphingobacterium gobiense]